MKHLVCFHLFNDYSGSPKALKMVLEGMLKIGITIDLVTSRGGVLDELSEYPGIKFHYYPYKFSKNSFVTMFCYTLVQLYTFFLAFRWLFKKNVTFYVNTLLPAGPALAGKLMGKKVVYHYHENAFVKGVFYSVLAWIMQRLADRIICVSAYQASFLGRKDGVVVVPNALPNEFVERLKQNPDAAFERKTVLMLSSLKEYKGTREFISLAESLPQYKFVLVINDTQENINNYLKSNFISTGMGNLHIFSRQRDVAPFYNSASILICLTNPALAVETFGLTALEAMSAGLPVIVPTVGGIAEMVEDGVNGYKIEVANLERIECCIDKLLCNKKKYIALAESALKFSKGYSEDAVVEQIMPLL